MRRHVKNITVTYLIRTCDVKSLQTSRLKQDHNSCASFKNQKRARGSKFAISLLPSSHWADIRMRSHRLQLARFWLCGKPLQMILMNYRSLAATSQLQLLSAMLEGKVKVWNTEMSTNVKRATRKGLLPDYYSTLAIIFNISDYIQYYSRIFFKNFFCSFLFSLQHGVQIRSSSCVTSRESGLLMMFKA